MHRNNLDYPRLFCIKTEIPLQPDWKLDRARRDSTEKRPVIALWQPLLKLSLLRRFDLFIAFFRIKCPASSQHGNQLAAGMGL